MVTIAELRAKHNKMSQRELAKELGVTQTSISNWEKDQTKISGEYLISLALFFDVSTDDILGINKQATQNFKHYMILNHIVERTHMNEITFTLYCTTSEEAITEVKKLKSPSKDRLRFNVNIKPEFY